MSLSFPPKSSCGSKRFVYSLKIRVNNATWIFTDFDLFFWYGLWHGHTNSLDAGRIVVTSHGVVICIPPQQTEIARHERHRTSDVSVRTTWRVWGVFLVSIKGSSSKLKMFLNFSEGFCIFFLFSWHGKGIQISCDLWSKMQRTYFKLQNQNKICHRQYHTKVLVRMSVLHTEVMSLDQLQFLLPGEKKVIGRRWWF